MNRLLTSFATILVSVTALQAGDWGKAPIPAKAPIEECLDIGGGISAGYLTDYVLHGLRVNRDSVWTDVNYTFDALVPLTIGASHLSGINDMFPYGLMGPIDETDVYLSAEVVEVAGFEVTLEYRHRFLNFSGAQAFNGSYGDLSAGIRKDLGVVALVYEGTVGLNSRNSFFAAGGGEGWVHYAGLEKSIPLCDAAAIALSAGVGYHDGYYFDTPGSSDWSFYSIKASLPIELNCRTTLTPFIGYQGVQQWNVFDPQGDLLHGGFSLEVAF